MIRAWIANALMLVALGSIQLGCTPREDAQTAASPQQQDLYLDLMKLALTDLLHDHSEKTRAALRADQVAWHAAVAGAPYPYPERAHTMIGLKRLDNIRELTEDVLARKIPGDLIEAGAWRGGATIYMRAILKAHGVTDRVVWVADSFEGLPPPDAERYPADEGLDLSGIAELAVSREEVEANFARYGLLDEQVRFLKGWFKDTLPGPVGELAILRIDADLYESTMDAITTLYPKLAPGGYVIVDDYGSIPACMKATEDYRAAHGITVPVETIDWTGVYWRKP